MTALVALEAGTRVGPWTIDNPLGCGLNGEVWSARNVHCRPVALKIPLRLDPDSEVYGRFVREVRANRTLKGRLGLLPFVDAHLPEIPSDDDRPWLAMERAEPLHSHLAGAPLEHVVTAMADITTTLAGLVADRIFYTGHQVNASVSTIGRGANLYAFNGTHVIEDLDTVQPSRQRSHPPRSLLDTKRRFSSVALQDVAGQEGSFGPRRLLDGVKG